MRLVIQRVNKGSVEVSGKVIGEIKKGLFVLVGVKSGDQLKDAEILADKLSKLRIMGDDKDKMNLSVIDTTKELLVVSQFTLYADTSAGNRPSFIRAGDPKVAEEIYNHFVRHLRSKDLKVATGEFGTYMNIDVELDGPVTIILENERI